MKDFIKWEGNVYTWEIKDKKISIYKDDKFITHGTVENTSSGTIIKAWWSSDVLGAIESFIDKLPPPEPFLEEDYLLQPWSFKDEDF